MNSCLSLLRYYINAEYRNIAQSFALVLFVWIVAYIIYRVYPDMSRGDFNYLYWIFMMLLSINITLRSESHHGAEEHLFLYTCADPIYVLIAKILFNFVYLFVIGILFYGFFHLYFDAVMSFSIEYVGLIGMGALAISACLSFVTSINNYSSGQNTLISILALPLLIPVILILKSASDGIIMFSDVENTKYLTLISISFITIALSTILFPFVWRQ